MKTKIILSTLMFLIVFTANAQEPFNPEPDLNKQIPFSKKLPQPVLNSRDELMRRMYDKVRGTYFNTPPSVNPDAYGMPQKKDGGYIGTGLPPSNHGDVTAHREKCCNTSDYLDPSFAGKGWTTTAFSKGNISDEGSTASHYVQVLVQKDGKYVVVFDIAGSTILARGLPDGTLDKSFGTNGFSSPLNMESWAAVLQSDGKILAAGQVYGNSWEFALARYNADGTLDNSFDGDGIAVTDFGGFDGPLAVAVQRNGKIVLAGYTYNLTTYNIDFALARYNTNGTLDKSFGEDGKVTTDFGPTDYARSIAIQSDGRIVVSGSVTDTITHYSDFALARYNTNGALDKSFDGDGKLTTDFGSGSSASDIALQSDGKIVAAGSAFDLSTGYSDFVLARYKPDGNLDMNFDKDGKVITDFGVYSNAFSVALQSDDKIVVEGSTFDLSTYHYDNFALARYKPNGKLDNSFDGDGKLTTDFGGDEFAKSLALQSDGKIVVAGQTRDTTTNNYDFALARYKPDGSLDNSFSGDGKVTGYYPTPSGSYQSVAHQSDGKIVVAGSGMNPSTGNSDFALVRYNPNGTLDNSFGGDGKVTTDFGSDEFANSIAFQSDGKIVAAGYAFNPNTGNYRFALARYNRDGTLDNSFGTNGKVTTHFRNYGSAYSLALQSDGKIVAAGITFNYDTYIGDFALARYNPDGTLDNSFGGDGKVTTDFGSDDGAYTVALQSDGKIVAAGYVSDPNTGNSDFALVRYNTDGTLDNSFGGDGKVTTDFGGYDVAPSLALQSDGKIVLAGYTFNLTTYNINFALARYNTNGALDKSFDGDGKLTTDFGSGSTASDIALQSDGKIVAAGSAGNNIFALARYKPDGSLDKSFDDDGKLTTDFGANVYASSCTWRNGKLYVAGLSYDFDGIYGSWGSEGLVAVYLTRCESDATNLTVAKGSFSNMPVTKTNTAFDAMLFPNPAHSTATLQIEGTAKDVTISIADMSGKIVWQGNYSNVTTINLPTEKLSAGIYMVTITSGKESKTIKLLKQ